MNFTQLADQLWIFPRPLKFFGMQIGTHMTVVRLKDGGLFLHSPVALDAQTLMELQSLGTVQWIVAPNRLHHLFLGDYFKVFPEAKVYAAPGLEKKRSDLPFHGVLGRDPDPPWADEIAQWAIPDLPILNEVEFFHRASRTLILTDIVYHLGKDSPFIIRQLCRVFRIYKKFGPTPDLKYFIKRRPRAQQAIREIMAWDFDRVIVAHGDWVERGGKKLFQQAFNFLPPPKN